jgi:2-polyprenyl-3-methyl-5-hydroxy-6-metoxy-1,4-benzoquinol methylase
MGYSDPENKPWALEKIKEIDPKTVLDCGAGAGTYLDLIKANLGYQTIVVGVEAWYPYIIKYDLEDRYDILYPIDIRDMASFQYDLVILGDILEHMSEDDAVLLWNRISEEAKYALISIPIIHYEQGAINDNPYEVHVEEDWTTEKVLQKFSNIVEYKEFSQTGVFIAKFKGAE